MPIRHIDSVTLEAALIGYEAQRSTIEAKIAEIRRQLRARAPTEAAGIKPKIPREKRTMSAATRKRIAAAQRKRWAAYRKSNAK